MNIPEIDQKLATIKAMHTQYINGYHISKQDYIDYLNAMIFVTELQAKLAGSTT